MGWHRVGSLEETLCALMWKRVSMSSHIHTGSGKKLDQIQLFRENF